MQISDLLRKLADLIDQTEGVTSSDDSESQNNLGCRDHLEVVDVDNTDETDSETMVSPLQQEHELLKKSQGVENNVDEFAEEEDDEGFDKELERMKQIAGIGQDHEPTDYSDLLSPVNINPRAVAASESNSKQDPRLMQTKHRDQN